MTNKTKHQNKDIFVLIDAHALIHRSFHAIPPLSRNGQQLNAVYGFGSTVLSVLEHLKPKYLAVAFDEKGPTFRHQQFQSYKATRMATPESLKSQFPIARELIAALSIPIFAVTGYEADDVIGTLAKQATGQGIKTIIVTGDHDMYQLIDDSVRIYNVSRGSQSAELIDTSTFQKQYGFNPIAMIDYKALRGDVSDNIPGVRGIGKVTAAKLIAQFGTIEKLYQTLDCDKADSDIEMISISLKQKLCSDKEQAVLSKQLVTISTDVPINLTLQDCIVKHYDEVKAKQFLMSLGFRSLIPRLPKAEPLAQQKSLF